MTSPIQTMVDDLIAEIRKRPQNLKTFKNQGFKLVGYTGRFTPEELIYAAGAKPFLICRGGEPEPVEAVLPYMLRFLNPFVRAQLGYFILGIDPVTPMLDQIAVHCDDCHSSRLADLFEYLNLPAIRIGIPTDWKKQLSVDYFAQVLEKFKAGLERLTGNQITQGSLEKMILIFNRMRELLKTISDLRKDPSPAIGGYDFIRMNHASFYWEPEDYIARLENIYDGLTRGESRFTRQAPRILIAGRVIAVGDYLVPKLVEDSGGVIVAEFLDEGFRHVDHVVSSHGILMKNLTQAYYSDGVPPCIFQPAWRERMEHLKRLIRDFAVDGVVWYQLSFDEIYDMEYPVMAKAMGEVEVPILHLESSYEYAREATGPLATRVESFISSIKARKG
ncbi:MAG: 2-hydroxyacyl-CoA dehydratase family protein [Desulfobacterales bacterium]|nr:2-hydroxyacyl-CoA dehydratase family protein [Desulfobacterales bacterium]